MAGDSAEIIRRGFDAVREGGVDALLPLVHPEFEFTTPAGLAAEPDTYHGHDGIRRWFDTFYEAMDEIAFDVADVVPVGELVVVPFRLRARGRTTGIEATQDAVMVWELEDGLLRRVDLFSGLEEARDWARDAAQSRPR